jgi:hypothetical protein
MVEALLFSLLLGAPEEAAGKLKVAWNSQYEWKESGVENATLDLHYYYHWKGAKEGQEWDYEGPAQVVVTGTRIVRSHFPGSSEDRRKQITQHLEWIVGRFARRPFDEEFKEMTFEGPETAKDGLVRVTVVSAGGSRRDYLLDKEDRLAGREWQSGSGGQPSTNRRTYTVGALGAGYAILGEDEAWSSPRGDWKTRRRLEAEEGEDYPFPKVYTYKNDSRTGTAEVRIELKPPQVNADHPVIGDPEARDALKRAWANRYVLPNDIRFTAQFHRRVDKDLAKLGWFDTVKGELRVLGLDRIEVALDDRLFRAESWTSEIKRLSEEHFKWMLGWMHDVAFEEEFADCGFGFADTEDGSSVVLLFGYGPVLGFRLQEGRIVGYRRAVGPEEDWWSCRLKTSKEGRVRIEACSTRIGRKTVRLRIKYARVKGWDLPRSFEALGGARWGRDEDGYGVAEYSLKKIKVTFAGGKEG